MITLVLLLEEQLQAWTVRRLGHPLTRPSRHQAGLPWAWSQLPGKQPWNKAFGLGYIVNLVTCHQLDWQRYQ